nr:efflux RND transporter permease subunit [Chthoniobacterales bacterium]
ILMTTIATVAGHMPLVFVTGAGAKARNSIGLVLVGGMTIGTIFTLFIVPSLYVLLAKTHHEGRGREEAETNEPEPIAKEHMPEYSEPVLAREDSDGQETWQPA